VSFYFAVKSTTAAGRDEWKDEGRGDQSGNSDMKSGLLNWVKGGVYCLMTAKLIYLNVSFSAEGTRREK
jgi:hypothetical protein